MPNTTHRFKEAVDPVCGMKADRSSAPLAFDARGRVYYFCSRTCQDEFQKDPARYTANRKSWWSRYLDRVRKATDGKPMSCCH